MSETHPSGGDAAAYALGALEPAEAEAFARHLESCAICRDEVSAFQRVVEALPMAAPQRPVPRGLRRRVLGIVRAESRPPQLLWRWLPRPRLAGGLVPRPALALATVALAALAILGAIELQPSSGGARVIQASVAGSPGSAELRLNGGHAELIVHHMRPPPAGRIYEVWLQRPHRPPSPTGALFSVTSGGTAEIGVPGDVRGISVLMVTPEPPGGSSVPTRAPVIVARLA